ncbi:MAG: hypothetical protein AB8F95_15305 [Bacteroidia bacterium]
MNFFEKYDQNKNRKRLRKFLEKAIVKPCPEGWQYEQFDVGGLTEVGFSSKKPDLLLVISTNGRGLFDCSKLEKVNRDYHDDFEIDYANLTCFGIGDVSDEKIKIAGLHGGGLPTGNLHGENLELMALDWPDIDIIFQPNRMSIYSDQDCKKCFNIYSADTLKVYGFSPSGKHFVIGTSSDLLIFTKE